jgi:uncharacterized protein
MNDALKNYLHDYILPIYHTFDRAHQEDHVLKVIEESITIAKDYELNMSMVYTIACYHDIGMQFGREDHHLTGGRFLYEDDHLKTFFSEAERKMMKEAIEDHRASRKEPPRSIYGKIIAEADRDIVAETIILRTVQFGFKNYPHLTKEEHKERAYLHIKEKYGPDGYLQLWLKTKKNQEGLNKIHALLIEKNEMEKMIETFYENEKKCKNEDANDM